MGCAGSSVGDDITQPGQRPIDLLGEDTADDIFRLTKKIEQNKKKQFDINCTQIIRHLREKYAKFYIQTIKKTQKTNLKGLEDQVTNIFMALIQRNKRDLNNDQIGLKQCKINISEMILQIQMEIIEFVQQKLGQKGTFNFFNQSEHFLLTLVTFLKAKFPRSQNLDAGQLEQQFKEFDSIPQIQYDILKNAGVCFDSKDQYQIATKIKVFINKIIQELQKIYPSFEKMIKKIDKGFKVGRKIPQNVSLYRKFDTSSLDIRYPQISRILIKWLQSLSKIINKGLGQKIQKSNEFKFYDIIQNASIVVKRNDLKQSLGQGQFQQKFANLLKTIQKKQKNKFNFKNDSEDEKSFAKGKKAQFISKRMKQQLNKFSVALIGNLKDAQTIKSVVLPQEMKIIKYSYFGNNFINWIVEQELIKSIQILVQSGMQVKFQQKCLDLIEFDVNDLMRCQIYGKRDKLQEMYKKLKVLQVKGKLEIVKIKNRFSTPMSDAMIYFKLPQSFIICQCQLILGQQAKGSEAIKMKNTESLNHYFYQLQRSPFGILAEICVFLTAKTSHISAYSDEIMIGLKEQNQNKVNKCLQKHQNIHQRIKQGDQKYFEAPYICSRCLKYNTHYKIINITICSKCSHKFCNECMRIKFQISQLQIQSYLFKKIQDQRNIKESQFTEKIKEFQKKNQYKDNAATYKKQIKSFQQDQKKYFFDSLFKIDNDAKAKFIGKKIKVKQINQYFVQKSKQSFQYFAVANYRNSQIAIKCYRFDRGSDNIVNAYQKYQKYEPHDTIEFNYYDFFLSIDQFKKKEVYDQVQQTGFYKFSINQYLNEGVYVFDGQKKNQLVKFCQNIPPQYQKKYQLAYKYKEVCKIFPFRYIIDVYSPSQQKQQKLSDRLNQIPKLSHFWKELDLQKKRIVGAQFDQFETFEQIRFIKILNLRQNKIKNIESVFKKCSKLKYIDFSLNEIQILNFPCPLDQLQELYGESNKITQINNLEHINNISILILKFNKIKYLFKDNQESQKVKRNSLIKQQTGSCNLSEFQQTHHFQISSNKFFENIIKMASSSSLKQRQNKFSKLSILNLSFNQIENLNILQTYSVSNLKDINLQGNNFKKINFENCLKIENVNIKYNPIENISSLAQNKCFNTLKKLFISGIRSNLIPRLSSNLKHFAYEDSQLTDQELKAILDENNLQNLQQLRLSRNAFKKLPNISKLVKLRQLYLDQNPISDISNLSFQLVDPKANQFLRSQHIFIPERKYEGLSFLWISLDFPKINEFKVKLAQFSQQKITFLICQIFYHSKNQRNSNALINEKQQNVLIPKSYYLERISENIKQKQTFKYRCNLRTRKYLLDHCNPFIIDQLLRFDWESVQEINFVGCQIDDQKWKTLVSFAKRFQSLEILRIYNNLIQTINEGDLDKFKNLKQVFFCLQNSTSPHTNNNPLKDQSKKILKRYNEKKRCQPKSDKNVAIYYDEDEANKEANRKAKQTQNKKAMNKQ